MAGPILDQAVTFSGDAQAVNSAWYLPASLAGQSIEYTFYVQFSAASAAGTVLVETSFPKDGSYSGTWATIATITWAANTSQKYASVTGVFSALRLRVSSTVTSGTVSGWVVAAAES